MDDLPTRGTATVIINEIISRELLSNCFIETDGWILSKPNDSAYPLRASQFLFHCFPLVSKKLRLQISDMA